MAVIRRLVAARSLTARWWPTARWGLSALGLLAGLASYGAAGVGTDPHSGPNIDPATRDHIRHIEGNLLPAVVVDGAVAKTTTLASQMQQLGVPGVSIAFIHRGKVEWTDAVGVRWIGGPPVDSNTVFQAASISKPVTAIAVMALKQSGKLDLDRDVNGYLHAWKLADGKATVTERVTLRRLLSHTAGTTVHGFDGYPSGDPVPSPAQILNGEKPANSPPVRVADVPGSLWSYSGGGYVIVQQALMDLTGTPFAKLMDDMVLRPASMHRSSFEQPLAPSLRKDAAKPYDSSGHLAPGGAHTYPEQAAAGLWTTPSDLTSLVINLQHSLAGGSNGILTAATAREMLAAMGSSSWSLGFRVGGGADHPYFMHGGSNAGYRSLLVAFEDGDGVAIMTNGDGGYPIASALLRTIAVEYAWPAFQPKRFKTIQLPAEWLDRFVGQYRQSAEVAIAVTRKGKRLYLQVADDTPSQLTPEGQTSFFSATSGTQVTFGLDTDRRPTRVHVDSLLAAYDAHRIE